MTRVCDIDLFMSEWADKRLSEEWDNDGVMLCADVKGEVKKVLVCLEINKEAALFAKNSGCDLIVTHHPYIFRPLKNICGVDYEIASIFIKGGISVLSYHTRLDAAQGGVNDTLAKTFGLCNVESFSALGRVGHLEREMDEEEFFSFVKQKLSCDILRTSKLTGKKIKKVAVTGGAGKDFLFDAAGVADAYITGDLSHNAFISANELGLLAVDAGHYHTENPVTIEIAKRLSENFPEIDVTVFDCLCPFSNF